MQSTALILMLNSVEIVGAKSHVSIESNNNAQQETAAKILVVMIK